MDHDRFDDLTRWLAAGASRRATLHILAAGTFATGFVGLGLDDAAAKCVKPGKKCKSKHGKNKKCCAGAKCKGKKCKCSGGKQPCGQTCCPTSLRVCPSGCDFANVQDAVDAIAEGGTIEILAGTYPGTIHISLKDLTLVGAGTAATVLDGDGQGSVLDIGSTVQVQDLTIRGGNGSNPSKLGGGIFNSGTLTLTRVSVTENSASSYGGGIYNPNGTLTLTDSSVSDNVVSGVLGVGGGIANVYGTVTLQSGSITGNSAGNTGGGIYNLDGTVIVAPFSVTGNAPNNCDGDAVANCIG